MKVKLGYCPYCNSDDYTRDSPELDMDFVRVECTCNHCDKDFIEYFGLDEVYTKGDKEFSYTKNLSDDDMQTIKGWAEAELEMKPEQFVNLDHYKDYIRRVKRIIKVMNGEAYKE